MKKFIFSSFVIFFMTTNAFGQSPNWSVNENDFQYTMSFVSFLNVDGNELSNTNDKIAAFVNGQVRGVTNLIYVASEDSYYAFLTIFSNANGETLHFKIYDSVNNVIKDVEKTETFEINAHLGNLFQAYSLANPTLSDSAEITSFSFDSIANNDVVIDGTQINIFLNKGQNITALNAIFGLSNGANLFIGTVKQISGSNSIDFTSSIQFQVVSEDQSVAKQWTVIVTLGSGDVTYYKKDTVCYNGGVIKVLFSENDVEVILTHNGIIHASQTITGGEAIFENLTVGTYKVKVGGNIKEINIEQK